MPDFSMADSVGFIRRTFLAHQPPAHARMTDPGYDAKYYRVPTPIGNEDLRAHLAGEITLACQLASDGLAWAAACDIDIGGLPAIRAVMRAAELRGCHAYGFVLTSDTHDGGHVWILFAQAHVCRDVQSLMRDILNDSGIRGAEVYPSAADLRLPFGIHRRCGRRGDLLLNSTATPIPIDPDPMAALASFEAQLQLTGSAPVEQARSMQEERRRQLDTQIAEARAAQPRMSIGGQPTGIEIIQAFNASTDLVRLLAQYGGVIAYRYADGKVLMHCAANQDHRNGDAHPSLIVQSGTGRQAGKLICGCYSPNCRLHNNHGQVKDPFEVYCIMEGIDHREGVKRLSCSSNPTHIRGSHGHNGGTRGVRKSPSIFNTTGASYTPLVQHQGQQEEVASYTPPAHPIQSGAGIAHAGQAQGVQETAGISKAAQSSPQATSPLSPSLPVSQSPSLTSWRTAAQSRLEELRRSSTARPMDKQLYAYLIERCTSQPYCRPSNAAAAAALGVCEGTIKLTKRRLTQLGYIVVTPSKDGKSTSEINLLLPITSFPRNTEGVIGGSPESKLRIELTKKGGGNTPQITPSAPELGTTPATTQYPAATIQPAAITQPNSRTAARQQRHQTHNNESLLKEHMLLLAKSDETTNRRQRYVLRQLAIEIEAELDRRGYQLQETWCTISEQPATTAQPTHQNLSDNPRLPAAAQPVRQNLSDNSEMSDMVAQLIHHNSSDTSQSSPVSGVRLAAPNEPHAVITDQQLTAILRYELRVRSRPFRRTLIEQLWFCVGGAGQLRIVCPPGCHEQVVTSEVLPMVPIILSCYRLEYPAFSIMRGKACLSIEERPAWLSARDWAHLPIDLRAALIGSQHIGGVLYGATPTQTAQLNEDRSGGIALVLTLLADYLNNMEQSSFSFTPQLAPFLNLTPAPDPQSLTSTLLPQIADFSPPASPLSSRHIRIGDRPPIMPEDTHDLMAGILLGEASTGHPALNELLSERSSEAMQSLGLDAEHLTGIASCVLQAAGQLRAIHPEPILASWDGVESSAQRLAPDRIGIGQDNQALPPALGICATHENSYQFAVQIGLTQPSDFIMPQASSSHNQQHLPELHPIMAISAQVLDQLVGLGGAVATTRSSTPNASVQRVRCQRFRSGHIPTQGVQCITQFTQASQGILNVRPAQPFSFHRIDNQLDMCWAEFTQQLRALLRSQPLECCDAALAMAAQALIAEDRTGGGTIQLSLMAALPDACDFLKGMRDLFNEAWSLFPHRWFLWSYSAVLPYRRTMLFDQRQQGGSGAILGEWYGEADRQRRAIARLCPPRHLPYNTPQRRGFVVSVQAYVEVATSVSADVITSSAQTRAPPERNPVLVAYDPMIRSERKLLAVYSTQLP